MLIYLGSDAIATVKNSKNKVLIPVASASKEHQIPGLSDASLMQMGLMLTLQLSHLIQMN